MVINDNSRTRATRITTLLDEGSFVEFESGRPQSETELQTGWGTIDGRKVFVYSLDGGIHGLASSQQICELMDLARTAGAPVIALRGPTTQMEPRQTVESLAAYGRILDASVRNSAVIPQISVVTGRWLGGPSLGAALSDVTIAAGDSAQMYVNNPQAVEFITEERVSDEELGGVRTHASRSGVAGLTTDTEDSALALARYVLSFLPDNNLQSPPTFAPTDDPQRLCPELETLLPASKQVPYDVVELINALVDDGEILQLHEHWARNIVSGFGRLDGHAIGIVASQPAVLAGTLDIDSSIKAARFVRLCNAFNIPLLAVLDVPGFRPGVDEEYRGIIRHGAKLVYAFAQATVPKVTLIARKAYGGAYLVMNSRHIRADLSFAWPTAEIAVMGAEGAVKIIHRREIATADNPREREAELAGNYREAFSNPYRAAERGYVDDVIRPSETRRKLVAAFEMLRMKRETLPPRKHGNIPL